MDTTYFHGSQQYHHFMPVSPPTPSSSGLEDFDTSPSQEPLQAHQFFNLNYGDTYNSAADGLSDSLLARTTSGQDPYAQMQRSGAGATRPRKGDGGTSDDDNGLTPAQSRRKAQNRAAQQAFRKRKEDHIKDLKAKVTDLEAMQQQVLVENKRLKQDLQKVSTENEILRATSQIGGSHDLSPESADLDIFTHGRFLGHPHKTSSSTSSRAAGGRASGRSGNGAKRLDSNATWEYIINHELFKKGLVDINDISQRLKSHAHYDSRGPTFTERSINTVIAQSVASGTDDLI